MMRGAGDATRRTRLMLDLRPGQVVRMAGCTIEIQPRPANGGRGGRSARLLITAPADVVIERPTPHDEQTHAG